MDLPPRFRRHPRYGEVHHPPHFIHQHLTPLPLSPPPPPPLPPHILLPPLPPMLPPRHDGQLLFPSHFSSPPYPPIRERSYFHELDPSRRPYFDRYSPPMISPPHQEDIPFRIIHDYPRQESFLEDEIFRRGCNNSHVYDLPRTLDRKFPWGATEVNSRISDIEHRDRISSSRVSVIEVRDMWKDTNDYARRWDNGSRELYFEREDGVRRWDCGIDMGRELCFDRNNDARRCECVVSGGRKLPRDDDGIRFIDGISLEIESRQQEFFEGNLGMPRFSGRLGRQSSKREFHRPKKMKRVQKKSDLHRIQLGKESRRHIRGKKILKNSSSSSFRGKEKENIECFETITKDNQETEQGLVDLSISFKSNSLVAKAILVPSSPVSKEEICLSTRNQKVRKINSMADTGSAKSSEVVTEQTSRFQSGSLCSQIEPLEKFNVCGNGNRTAYKTNSLGDNFGENEASKDVHSHGLNNFRYGRRLGCRSKKKRGIRKKILHGTRLQLSEDSGEIVNFEASTISTSDASKLNTDSTFSEVNMSCVIANVFSEPDTSPSLESMVQEKEDVNSDTNRPSLSDRKRKKTSLNILSASLNSSDDVSTKCPGHVGINTAKDADSADFHVQKRGPVLDLEKNFLQSKDLLSSLGAIRVDRMNEQPLQDGLELSGNAFNEVPVKCPTSVEVVDITGLSRHHATKIPKVQDDKHLSEYNKSCIASVCENSSFKEVGNVVYDMKSADVSSKEFFPYQVIIPEIRGYSSSNSKDARISEAAAVADCSNVSVGPATRSNFVSGDHKGIVAEDDISLVERIKQWYTDRDNLSNKSWYTERTSESKNYVKTGLSIDNSSRRKRKRKRKARGTQMGISGSIATESVVKGSSADDGHANLLESDISSVKEAEGSSIDDEPANLLATDISSVKEAEGSSVDDEPANLLATDISSVKEVEGSSVDDEAANILATDISSVKVVGGSSVDDEPANLLATYISSVKEADFGGSSVDDEPANLLATYISSVKEADFRGAEDNSEVNFILKEGPSVDEDSHLDGVDFSGDGSFPGNRKERTVVSPRSNFSSRLADDLIGDCHASNDLKLDQVSHRLAEKDADQREETPSAMHVPTTDGSEKVSIPDMNGTLAYGSNNIHLKDDLPFIPNTLSMCADGSDDCATQSGNELVASGFDTPSCMSSPEDLLSYTNFHSESEMNLERFRTSNIKPVSRYSKTFSLRKSVENATSDRSQTNAKAPPLLPQKIGKVPSRKNKLTSAVPNSYSGHPAFNLHTSRKLPSTKFAKSRTWHRTNHSSNAAEPTLQPCPLPQSRAPKLSTISQGSYIRKGNSLVRKPSSSGVTPAHILRSSVYPSSLCIDYSKNNQVVVDTPCIPRIGQVNTSEVSQSVPLNHTGRSLKSASCLSVESLAVANPLGSGGPTRTLDALKETVKSFEIPEWQTGSGNNSDSQSTFGKENAGKKISYVKRRSNQLVATSDPEDSSISGLDKSRASLSDGYYKNSKNQLIRVSSESHARKGDSEATLNLNRLRSQTILPISFGKRQSNKGFAKTCKLSKFPLVWNLNGAKLPEKSSNSFRPQRAWPFLFPWKRATYRRSSLSTISQKLLLSSKRGAIYTRSTHGYSLRISKVLSVCGRSLKWSKSIERNSKKANEEATRAVATAEKMKKEEKGAISVLSKSRNNVSRKSVVSVKLRPGERIFRIGYERYKMDPSRRSLHRITAEEEASTSVPQSEKNLKKSYVPKRLLIGNDEYVRIGTGNQLVRDPKKRTRVLASEKVRWSLRTVRLRLARKRKYCQFFTRFGKCNKSDGKCPYIHDPSKIVVCTKFLNDACTDSDCKLTHKVIPERMQDCSYFLKGSCSNENCPYRHVNVNPESSICKRFLRGYCADGNECRKKHTYACPDFESTGICPRSSMCKLHHPKKKTENKPESEQKIVRGRYFDGGLIDATECIIAASEKHSAKGEDDIVCEVGKFPDYISLDISYDGTEDA